MSKLYAQFNEEGICTCIGTPNVTGIEATYDCLGKKYENGIWIEVEADEVESEEVSTDEMANAIIEGVNEV